MIEAFSGHLPTIIGGSTWPEDEKILIEYLLRSKLDFKLILAPHEVDSGHITQIMNGLPPEAIRYSDANLESIRKARVLVIDNIGMLSNLYRHADIAMIGGGFGRGIHNTLEAATYGLPILFGPNYERFKEAVDLINLEGATLVSGVAELSKHLDTWLENPAELKRRGNISSDYVQSQKGATNTILEHLNLN